MFPYIVGALAACFANGVVLSASPEDFDLQEYGYRLILTSWVWCLLALLYWVSV